jgi:4-amino-4-deoxy-L-arabinose transferase-like glycosyltransferase
VRWVLAGRRRPALVDAIAWTVMLAFAAASIWQIVRFYTTGGNPHVRYMYAALPVGGTLAAVAFRQLPWNRRNAVTTAIIGCAIVFDLYLLHLFCNVFNPGADTGPVGVVAWVLLAGAFTLIARELRRAAPPGPA